MGGRHHAVTENQKLDQVLISEYLRHAARPKVWYHGDTAKRPNFNNQNMDRDRSKDPNAMGPGIYWTSDKRQAVGYAGGSGWVYTAEIKTTKVIKDRTRIQPVLVRKLIELGRDPDGDLQNFGEFNNAREREAVLQQAVDAYVQFNDNLMDALLTVSNDFYGREDANLFAKAMVKIGIDAFLHKLPQVWHLIVYNPKVIKVTAEEKSSYLRRAAAKRFGYKVMRWHNGKAISGADSRQSFRPKKGAVIRLRGIGIWLSLNKQYVVDHYAGHDENIVLKFEFDPADVTKGNLTDRHTEFAVSKATLVDFEIVRDDD